ncbi:PAS domain S-box protein [Pedobacter nutrimenti]|jgi:PAS domain S-box-containing protein|uniref:histidine kinase n=1 Tax=Pedobacter nutrimenti TaxID=1241337 RepID=A0A318UKH7_9SPHI|nr:PAS domain S-box protein [Pedobacter nutrimenti]PYF68858.1 PAS domain S-box-containing protein [Pedobacter nutrimenti]
MDISEEVYKDIFYKSPVAKLILKPDAPHCTILDANEAYLSLVQRKRESLVGQSVSIMNPPAAVLDSICRAIESKEPQTLEHFRYDLPTPGTDTLEERYWSCLNTPVMDARGELNFLIHTPRDITESHRLLEREKAGVQALKNQRKQLYSIFMQAPVGIAIFKGADFRVDLINPTLCEIYGKSPKEMIDQPVFEVLFTARRGHMEKALHQVMESGKTVEFLGMEVPLIRKGLLEKVYIDFVYEPFFEKDHGISGVIVVATEVTEQVNAMRKLEEAEERARLAADAVDMGIFDLNLLSGEMVTSERFANIFGFEKPVSRDEYFSVYYPQDLKIRSRAYEKAIVTGVMFYEARIVWSDQSLRWIRAEGKVIYDKEQNPLRLLGTLLDITEQKRSKEEQQKLISLVNNSADLMSVMSLEGFNTYINASGMQLLGMDSAQQMLKTPLSELHSAEELNFVQQTILPEVFKEGKWAGKLIVRNVKTKELIPVYNYCIRIDDIVTGQPIAIGAIMRDMRPELKAKQALEDSELQLRSITTASPTALWMSDANGEITYVNQSWLDWSGQSLQENLGRGWTSVIFPEDRRQVLKKFQNDTNLRHQYEVEFRINHADGTPHWCVAAGQPQHNAQGVFMGYIGSCTDITEQKELQHQKDNFIGIASHELKTPVTSIKAYTQVLEKMLRKKGDEKEADMIRKMDLQLNRLVILIGDLLDVTKMNTGKLPLNNQAFNLNQVISNLAEDIQRTTENHVLETNLKTIPAVFGDKDRIEQVVINLITNAIKYSPHAKKIIIHSQQMDDEVIVCIQDFGVGISPQNLPKVFEQFYRVSGEMQHTFPGLGLGLYISSEIIKRSGGRIWVNSTEGKGSSFYFAVPVAKSSASSPVL